MPRSGRHQSGSVKLALSVHTIREQGVTHVSTSVQQDSRSLRSRLRQDQLVSFRPASRTHLDVPLHALKVKSDRFLVKVGVVLDFQSGIFGDRNVVAPRRSRKVKRLGAGVESGEEGGTDPESTSTRDRLGDG